MTFKELKDMLESWTSDQLDSAITIGINDEFYGIARLEFNDASQEDRLDDNQPILIVET